MAIIFLLIDSDEEMVRRGKQALKLSIDANQHLWMEHDVLCMIFIFTEAYKIENTYQDVGLSSN